MSLDRDPPIMRAVEPRDLQKGGRSSARRRPAPSVCPACSVTGALAAPPMAFSPAQVRSGSRGPEVFFTNGAQSLPTVSLWPTVLRDAQDRACRPQHLPRYRGAAHGTIAYYVEGCLERRREFLARRQVAAGGSGAVPPGEDSGGGLVSLREWRAKNKK
jgi:hypothetical protein